MLKLNAEPTFTVPVVIPAPTGNVTIKVTYKHMTRDAYLAFVKAESEKARPDEDAIMDIASAWSDVDEPFSREAVGKLCQQYHAAPRVIVETFIRELTQFKEKN